MTSYIELFSINMPILNDLTTLTLFLIIFLSNYFIICITCKFILLKLIHYLEISIGMNLFRNQVIKFTKNCYLQVSNSDSLNFIHELGPVCRHIHPLLLLFASLSHFQRFLAQFLFLLNPPLCQQLDLCQRSVFFFDRLQIIYGFYLLQKLLKIL